MNKIMTFVLIFALFVLPSLAFGQQSARTQAKAEAQQPNLSDDFAKAAIKYVIAVQNFELNATTDTIAKAKSRIESAKEDMEAAETAFACDEKITKIVGNDACPEHITSVFLELEGSRYVTEVETFHLTFKPEAKAQMDKSAACFDAWKNTLQRRRRNSTQPDACNAPGPSVTAEPTPGQYNIKVEIPTPVGEAGARPDC